MRIGPALPARRVFADGDRRGCRWVWMAIDADVTSADADRHDHRSVEFDLAR
jgi:hypothetical protein